MTVIGRLMAVLEGQLIPMNLQSSEQQGTVVDLTYSLQQRVNDLLADRSRYSTRSRGVPANREMEILLVGH
jgi:hypothetical protein